MENIVKLVSMFFTFIATFFDFFGLALASYGEMRVMTKKHAVIRHAMRARAARYGRIESPRGSAART